MLDYIYKIRHDICGFQWSLNVSQNIVNVFNNSVSLFGDITVDTLFVYRPCHYCRMNQMFVELNRMSFAGRIYVAVGHCYGINAVQVAGRFS